MTAIVDDFKSLSSELRRLRDGADPQPQPEPAPAAVSVPVCQHCGGHGYVPRMQSWGMKYFVCAACNNRDNKPMP